MGEFPFISFGVCKAAWQLSECRCVELLKKKNNQLSTADKATLVEKGGQVVRLIINGNSHYHE